MRAHKSKALVAGAAAIALAAAGCGSSGGGGGGGSKGSGQVIFGESTDFPQNFLPLISAGNATSVANVEIRALDGPFLIAPSIAYTADPEQGTVTSSMVGGQQVLDIKVNPKAVWADGQPITADDYIFTTTEQKSNDPKTGGCADLLSTVGFDQVVKTQKVSDKEAKVYFDKAKPFADWRGMYAGSNAMILSKHLMDKGSPAATCAYLHKGWPVAGGIPLGATNGPWMLPAKNVDASKKTFTLLPNPKYWGAKPKLARLVYQNIGSVADTNVKAIQNGEVGMVYPQPQLDLVSNIKKLSNLTTKISFGSSFEHLDFNTKVPLLDKPQIRKAIALAIDRNALVGATVGKFSDQAKVLGNRLILSNQPGYVDHGTAYNAQSIAKAKQLIESVGGKLGSDGYYKVNGKQLSFRVSTTQGNPLRDQTVLTIAAQVKAAGIKLTEFQNPDIFAGTDKPNSLVSEGFQIALFAWVGGPSISAQNSIYVTKSKGGGQNYSQGSDPVVDAALSQISGAQSPAAEIAAANKADAQLWQDMYTLPLYQKPTFLAYEKNLNGVVDNATQAGPLWNSDTWTVK
ncbi:MAG: ABC transporter substrate-binding protein [Jatrophihabitans sp.]